MTARDEFVQKMTEIIRKLKMTEGSVTLTRQEATMLIGFLEEAGLIEKGH